MNEVNSRIRHNYPAPDVEDGDCPKCGECPEDPTSHPCPFRVEIHGDEATACTCCYDCAHECWLDV